MKYVYNTTGTCTKQFGIEIEHGRLVKLESAGGCPGNLIGMAALVQDMEIDEIIKRLEGIKCGGRPTSCPDQLAQALKQIRELETNNMNV